MILFCIKPNNNLIPIIYNTLAILPVWWHTFCVTIRIMNIRIDFNSDGSKNAVLISGRLSSSTVAHLKKACDSIRDSFVIDLSNLLFADEDGINAIRTIVDKGAQIRGASPFVQLLLDSAQDEKRMLRDQNLP